MSTADTPQILLEHHLKALRLPTIVKGGVKREPVWRSKSSPVEGVKELRGVWRLERSGRRHSPRSAFGLVVGGRIGLLGVGGGCVCACSA